MWHCSQLMWINRHTDVGLHWTDLHRWVALMVSQAGLFGDECLVSVVMGLTWNDGVAYASRTAQVLIYGSDLADLVALRKKVCIIRKQGCKDTHTLTSKYTQAQTPMLYTFLIHPHKQILMTVNQGPKRAFQNALTNHFTSHINGK